MIRKQRKSNFRPERDFDHPQDDRDLVGMIKKLQQQMTFLERKIDQVLRELPSGQGSGGGGKYRPFKHRSGGESSFGQRGDRDFRSEGGGRRFKRKGSSKPPWMKDSGGGFKRKENPRD